MITISHPDKDFTGTIHLGPTLADFKKGSAKISEDVVFAPETVEALDKLGYRFDDEPATAEIGSVLPAPASVTPEAKTKH